MSLEQFNFDDWKTEDNYEPRSEDMDEMEDIYFDVDASFEDDEDDEINSLISSEPTKGGENMDRTNCLLECKKCINCGRHETSMLIRASEDGSETHFLGYIPIGTGVTLKRDE